MKSIVGISQTAKGGYWLHTVEPLNKNQGVGERTASYHIQAEVMTAALAQAELSKATELLGRSVGFDAREQFASFMIVIPEQANNKK